MFPEVAFDEDADWGSAWRGIFEEWLQRADEPPLWSSTLAEQYRFQTSTGGPGILLRVDADTGEAIVKRFSMGPDGWAVTERRRTLTARELGRLRRLVERSGLWALPSSNPRNNLGLDGAHYLFEARVGERYHLVQRWSPQRGGFARLCQYCESLYRNVVEPRRSWWRFW